MKLMRLPLALCALLLSAPLAAAVPGAGDVPPTWPDPIDDDARYGFLLIDRLEYSDNEGPNTLAWEALGWLGGGMLLGQKITERVAGMRNLPVGIDQRSACRHPDWTGPDDLEIKILEIREITNWEKPIYVKIGGARPYYDTALAVKAGADVVVLDGMQGGTAATQDVFIEHVGQPTLACIRPAVKALQDLGMHRTVQLIVSGGIRSGADVAKALALGADAVAIGTAALIALGENDPKWGAEYAALGTTADAYDDWHEGKDPAGITTQDPELMKRLDPVEAARKLRNYLAVLTLECQTIARACGKSHVHNLEPEDLCALTIEAAAMAGVPLAGTNWIPGQGNF